MTRGLHDRPNCTAGNNACPLDGGRLRHHDRVTRPQARRHDQLLPRHFPEHKESRTNIIFANNFKQPHSVAHNCLGWQYLHAKKISHNYIAEIFNIDCQSMLQTARHYRYRPRLNTSF